MPVASLPDLTTLDAATLRDMVVTQHAQISSRDEELERLHEQISWHGAEIERLRLTIARLQRLQFGRKSEKIQRQIEQLELQLEDLEARRAEDRQQSEKTLAPGAAAELCLLLHANRRVARCRSISHARLRRMHHRTTIVQRAAVR